MKTTLKNSFFYFFISLILLIKTKSEKVTESFGFLENKSVDHLRQMFWSGVMSIKANNDSTKNKYNEIWKANNIKKIKTIIKDYIQEKKISDSLLGNVKNNSFFNLTSKTINDLIEENEDRLPLNYLINFAFNIDKYDRTQKDDINSISEYISFYSRDQIKKYIKEKLAEYNKLEDLEFFETIVLNNINLDMKNTKQYVESKMTKNELKQFIYGFELYCFNTNKTVEEDCKIPYSLYDHENLKSPDYYSNNDLRTKLMTYYKKTNLDQDLHNFIFLIENRGYKYPNKDDFVGQIASAQLNDYVKAFEIYYKRQTNAEKSLSRLDDYIKNMPLIVKRDLLKYAIDLYPELGENKRFEDISLIERYLQFGQVKKFLGETERESILKYAYNIHTFHKNITSIYDDDLYSFIRMNDNLLLEKISKDANKNKALQTKESFQKHATLYKDNFNNYLNNLQRNQLKIILAGLIKIYYDSNNKEKSKNPSRKKERLDAIPKLNNYELIKNIKNLSESNLIGGISKTEELFNIENQKEKKYISTYFDQFENIMDFFRSTDINYLRVWLRKYELIIRKEKTETYMSGGLKTNYLNINEFTSQEILRLFDIYVHEYPELFRPKNFIKYVGLDKDMTPHKFLVENSNNKELILKITSSIVGHFQRKNIQVNFDALEFLEKMSNKNFTTEEDDNIIKERYLYQLFRLINIFPELNNKELFEIMCVNNKTRILSTNEINKDYFNYLYENDLTKLSEMAENIKYFYSAKKIEKEETGSALALVEKFYEDIEILRDDISKLRILYGDFYPVYYDYTFSINNLNDIIIDNIFHNLQKNGLIKPSENGNNSNKTNREIIIETIGKYEELQNPTIFDKEYNYIDFTSEYSNSNEELHKLYEFLNKTSTKNIFYYCIITNILKIKNKKDEKENVVNNDNENSNKPGDIYLNIRYISRVSMIRYILDVVKYNEKLGEKINGDLLPALVKYYMLDIGSDNIYNLTLY